MNTAIIILSLTLLGLAALAYTIYQELYVKRPFTMEEFLIDTIEFYGPDYYGRRGYDTTRERCCFRTPDGKKCAVGRYIRDEMYQTWMEPHSVHSLVHDSLPVRDLSWEQVRDPKVAALSETFLQSIQSFHDTSRHWIDQGGLSFKGKETVQAIVEEYHLDRSLLMKYLPK